MHLDELGLTRTRRCNFVMWDLLLVDSKILQRSIRCLYRQGKSCLLTYIDSIMLDLIYLVDVLCLLQLGLDPQLLRIRESTKSTRRAVRTSPPMFAGRQVLGLCSNLPVLYVARNARIRPRQGIKKYGIDVSLLRQRR